MSFKFQIKTLKTDNTESLSRIMIATSDDDAQKQVDEFLKFFANRGKPRKFVKIIKVADVKTQPRHQELVERTNIIPAYGDYEATGWMDKK